MSNIGSPEQFSHIVLIPILIYLFLCFVVYIKDYCRDLWHQITDARNGLELQNHRYELKTYINSLIGNELVDWLITHDHVNSR